MKDKKDNFWDLTDAQQAERLAERGKQIIAETHAAGRPTTHGDSRGVYQLYPDGHRQYIKRYTQRQRMLCRAKKIQRTCEWWR